MKARLVHWVQGVQRSGTLQERGPMLIWEDRLSSVFFTGRVLSGDAGVS